MPWQSKYKPRYTKELEAGLRAGGKTVVQVCLLWGIDPRTYENWIKEHPKFAKAALIGDMQYASYWSERYRATAVGEEHGNASLLQMAAKNVEMIDWKDKTEVHNTHDEQVHTLVIKTLPSYATPRVIEHEQGTRNLLDQEPS